MAALIPASLDTTYNQYAGIINHYCNSDAISPNDYPEGNHRNSVMAIALEPGTTNVLMGGTFLRVGGGSTRDDTRPRSNVARLLGGATPGPGNLEFLYNSYTVDENAGSPGLFVSLVRTNGSLGIIGATFSTSTSAAGDTGVAGFTNDFPLAQLIPLRHGLRLGRPGNAWMYDFGVSGWQFPDCPL